MARRVKDADLMDRASRAKLTPGTFKWRYVQKALALGYYRPKKGGEGSWVARLYDRTKRDYDRVPLGRADDTVSADGAVVLDFDQAVAAASKALLKFEGRGDGAGTYTLAQAMGADFRWREGKEADDLCRNKLKNLIDYEFDHTHENGKVERLVLGAIKIRPMELSTEILQSFHAAQKTHGRKLQSRADEPQRFAPFPTTDRQISSRLNTINYNNVLVQRALNNAYERKRVANDGEWRRWKIGKRIVNARPYFLEQEQVNFFLSCIDDLGFRNLMAAAFHTGARYGGLTRLKVRDYDRRAGTVYIEWSKKSVNIFIPLTPEGRQFFDTMTAGRPGEAIMFEKTAGERWRARERGKGKGGDQDAHMRLAVIKSGIRMNFHASRHSYCVAALRNGMARHVLMEIMGHRDMSMIDMFYGHIPEPFKQENVDRYGPRYGIEGTVSPASIPPTSTPAPAGISDELLAFVRETRLLTTPEAVLESEAARKLLRLGHGAVAGLLTIVEVAPAAKVLLERIDPAVVRDSDRPLVDGQGRPKAPEHEIDERLQRFMRETETLGWRDQEAILSTSAAREILAQGTPGPYHPAVCELLQALHNGFAPLPIAALLEAVAKDYPVERAHRSRSLKVRQAWLAWAGEFGYEIGTSGKVELPKHEALPAPSRRVRSSKRVPAVEQPAAAPVAAEVLSELIEEAKTATIN
jgi:integrase